MAGKLAQEIAQTKPWKFAAEEAFLNLAKTYEALALGFAELFRPHGLSITQYNVLRILRGAGAEGLSCTEAARRMITHDPDITRLFDRLEARGLIERWRAKDDRRVVRARITDAGQQVLGELEDAVRELHRRQMAPLEEREVHELIRMLELLRP
jgi:DNA-binding MarR family transcriptional regulator